MNCPYCDSHLDKLPANHICPHCTGPLDAKWREAFAREYAKKHAPVPPVIQPAPRPMPQQNTLCCPHCQGVKLYVTRRGYSWIWGAFGFFLFPLFGLLLGCIGSNKRKCICLSCGHRWQRV